MSDSDCSNCELECEYRDYSYDCIITEADNFRKEVTPDIIEKIHSLKEALKEKEPASWNDTLCRLSDILNEVERTLNLPTMKDIIQKNIEV